MNPIEIGARDERFYMQNSQKTFFFNYEFHRAVKPTRFYRPILPKRSSLTVSIEGRKFKNSHCSNTFSVGLKNKTARGK